MPIVCPTCRKRKPRSGLWFGDIAFCPDPPPEMQKHLDAVRQQRCSRGSTYLRALDAALEQVLRSTQADPNIRPVHFTGGGSYCDSCGRAHVKGETIALPSISFTAPLSACPVCASDILKTGNAYGTLQFRPENANQRNRLQALWDNWRCCLKVKVAAAGCPACGWVGIDPERLYEVSSYDVPWRSHV